MGPVGLEDGAGSEQRGHSVGPSPGFDPAPLVVGAEPQEEVTRQYVSIATALGFDSQRRGSVAIHGCRSCSTFPAPLVIFRASLISASSRAVGGTPWPQTTPCLIGVWMNWACVALNGKPVN